MEGSTRDTVDQNDAMDEAQEYGAPRPTAPRRLTRRAALRIGGVATDPGAGRRLAACENRNAGGAGRRLVCLCWQHGDHTPAWYAS